MRFQTEIQNTTSIAKQKKTNGLKDLKRQLILNRDDPRAQNG